MNKKKKFSIDFDVTMRGSVGIAAENRTDKTAQARAYHAGNGGNNYYPCKCTHVCIIPLFAISAKGICTVSTKILLIRCKQATFALRWVLRLHCCDAFGKC